MTNDATVRATARELRPRIEDAADEIESTQRLPDQLVKDLVDADLFQLYLREAVGGPMVDAATCFEAVEHVSRGDASVGWCVMVSSTSSYIAGWLADDTARSMFGTPPDLRLAGSSRPMGRATPVDDGYRVSGTWNFCSGIEHATWVIGSCKVHGSSTPRVMFMPVADVEIERTWDPMGMRGSGSHHIHVHDVFVPAERSVWPLEPPPHPDPLFDPRLVRVATHGPAAAVALGAAQGAIDAMVAIASGMSSTRSDVTLQKRPRFQAAIAEATVRVAAARDYCLAASDRAWTAARDGRDDADVAVALARTAYAQAGREAREATQVVFDASGSGAVLKSNPVEWRLRDIASALPFPGFAPAIYEECGQTLVGLDAEGFTSL